MPVRAISVKRGLLISSKNFLRMEVVMAVQDFGKEAIRGADRRALAISLADETSSRIVLSQIQKSQQRT
jgi:hypothetical protein